MTERERHSHVDHVGDREIGFLARLSSSIGMRPWLERQDGCAVDGPFESGEQFFGVGEEEIDEFGLVTAAGPLGDHDLHGRKSMVVVQRDGVLRHRHHANREFYCVAGQASRQPLAVPALIDLAETFADVLWQADALRNSLSNLTMPGQDRDIHLRAFGEAARHRLLPARAAARRRTFASVARTMISTNSALLPMSM